MFKYFQLNFQLTLTFPRNLKGFSHD